MSKVFGGPIFSNKSQSSSSAAFFLTCSQNFKGCRAVTVTWPGDKVQGAASLDLL